MIGIMWMVEYEQGPVTDRWVYKFDHEPIEDGGWHELFAGARARYRIVEGVLQYVASANDDAEREFESLLEKIGAATPLAIPAVTEVFISAVGSGFRVWSAMGFDFPDGIRITELTRDALTDAVMRVDGPADSGPDEE
jgi:hypothetical protein